MYSHLQTLCFKLKSGKIFLLRVLPFLFSGILLACSANATRPQTGTHEESVLYVGYTLYQKPVRSNEDEMTIPATIIVAALNADTGQKIWQRSLLILSPEDLSRFFYRVNVIVDNSRIYAIISTPVNGLVVALDARTGRILWKYTEHSGSIYAPIAANGAFYLSVKQNILQALDGQSGKLLWSASTSDYQLVQIAATNQAVYLLQAKFRSESQLPYDSEIVRALNLSDGTTLWQKEYRNTTSSAPAASITSLLPMKLQADDRAVYLFQLEFKQEFAPSYRVVGVNTLVALRAQDGSLLWSAQAPYDYLQAPKVDLALVGHMLYLVGGEYMSIFDVQDGKLLSAYTSPFYLWIFLPRDHLYGTTRTTGESFCSLKSSDGTKLWCSNLGVSQVVVGQENVYLFNQQDARLQQAIYILKNSNGSQAGRYTVDDPERVIFQDMASSVENL